MPPLLNPLPLDNKISVESKSPISATFRLPAISLRKFDWRSIIQADFQGSIRQVGTPSAALTTRPELAHYIQYTRCLPFSPLEPLPGFLFSTLVSAF